MGEIDLQGQTFVDELVGIVGMLDDKRGCTLTDISSVLRCLHGPVRQETIKKGLMSAAIDGKLECVNHRYKVYKERNASGKSSVFDAGCSSWGTGRGSSDNNSKEDVFSVSSLSTQADKYQEDLSTRFPCDESYSVKEIMSVKSIHSSGQFNTPVELSRKRDRSKLEGNVATVRPKNQKKIIKNIQMQAENENQPMGDDMSTAMVKVMKRVNNSMQSDNTKSHHISRKEERESVVRPLDGAITQVMNRLTGRDAQRNTTSPVAGNNASSSSAEKESNSAKRKVPSRGKDELPGCSNYKTPKLTKRGKNLNKENDEAVRLCGYFTRSRAKINEQRGSCATSPNNEVSSSKRAKFS